MQKSWLPFHFTKCKIQFRSPLNAVFSLLTLYHLLNAVFCLPTNMLYRVQITAPFKMCITEEDIPSQFCLGMQGMDDKYSLWCVIDSNIFSFFSFYEDKCMRISKYVLLKVIRIHL